MLSAAECRRGKGKKELHERGGQREAVRNELSRALRERRGSISIKYTFCGRPELSREHVLAALGSLWGSHPQMYVAPKLWHRGTNP